MEQIIFNNLLYISELFSVIIILESVTIIICLCFGFKTIISYKKNEFKY